MPRRPGVEWVATTREDSDVDQHALDRHATEQLARATVVGARAAARAVDARVGAAAVPEPERRVGMGRRRPAAGRDRVRGPAPTSAGSAVDGVVSARSCWLSRRSGVTRACSTARSRARAPSPVGSSGRPTARCPGCGPPTGPSRCSPACPTPGRRSVSCDGAPRCHRSPGRRCGRRRRSARSRCSRRRRSRCGRCSRRWTSRWPRCSSTRTRPARTASTSTSGAPPGRSRQRCR